MNTPLTLHGPAYPTWSHLVTWWRSWRPRAAVAQRALEPDDALDALLELDARMLDDIGAPERLISRAHAHREAQQQCHEDLRAGFGGTGWRHW
jgi:uncharacterized protein YjiS (DUF1127 family)